MDISLLNENFKRDRLIENWSSLIWSERWSANGDFELISPNISEIMSLMPLGEPTDPPVLVAVEGSDVPMVVETHIIKTPKGAPPFITTSGRSFETLLDRRQTVMAVTPSSPRVEVRLSSASVSGAVFDLANDIITLGESSIEDIIPEIQLLNSVVESGPTEEYVVEPKELYSWMLETLGLGPYGLRAEMGPSNTQIAVIIYSGVDRTQEVVFDIALEQIEDATYVLSTLGSKNTMITATQNGMEYSNTGVILSGLSRRVDFQDLSSEISVPVGPDLTSLTVNRGLVELANRQPTALFSGGVAQGPSSGYGTEYSLGDLVTLQGDYGLSQTARVAEFVRSQDATGYKAYPTFEAIAT